MNVTYWASTMTISAFLLLSAYTYFFSQNTINGLKDLGFPDYFRIQLGILKIIAVFALCIPSVPTYVKEWAYAGFFFNTALAFFAHYMVSDGQHMGAVIAFTAVLLSYFSGKTVRP